MTYTVQFQHPRARTVPITLRTLCGPMKQGSENYLLDKAGQDQVEAIYQMAASPSDDSLLVSAPVTGLDVGQTTPVTLATPCGVPPLLVNGMPYLATSYAAPGTNPPGWGTTQQGRLRRTTDNSLIFVADEGTVRIQFLKAPGQHLQGCTER